MSENNKIQNQVEEPVVETTEVATEESKETKAFTKGKDSKFYKKNTGSRRPQRAKAPSDGFIEKVVAIKRISKTTKGGRHMRFSALVVVGDKKGSVGFGLGKSIEIPSAIKKGIKNARNNVTKVVINSKGSVYHDVVGKACGSKVLIKPAKEGTGLIAGGAIRAVIELAGYKDICTKNLGKNTATNMIQATINGLKDQKTPESIALARDKTVAELQG